MYKDLKTTWKFYIVFILFSFLLILSYITVDTLFFGQQAQKMSLQNAVYKTKEREQYFNLFLKNSQNQLFAIQYSTAFQNYLLDKTTNLNDLFLTLIHSNKDIMQIRYIDKTGMEKIRVDKQNHNDIPKLIDSTLLQDKSQRYYFKIAKTKPLEKVFFSNINLNIENKEIERPYKPTLRAMLPITKDGVFGGVLIINYFMDNFLDELFNVPLYDMILVSKNGTFVKHYESEKNWSSNLKKLYSLQKEFPYKAKSILDNTLYIDDTIVSRRLNLIAENDLILIVQLSKKYQEESYNNQIYKYIFNGFIVLLFAIVASLFLSSLMKHLFTKYYKTEELNNTLEQKIALEVKKSKKQQLALTQQNKFIQMGEMISMIAHQWRQPLSAISSAVISIDMNIASGKFDTRKEQDVNNMIEFITKKHNNISDYVKFLSTTIDDFRNFFITDKDKKTIPLSSLVKNSLHIIQKLLESKGIEIIVDYKCNENVTIYQNELIQVILNILKNSEDNFQENKIKKPTIKIDVSKKQRYYSIAIKDNGKGIKEEIMEKIFEPYFSTKLEKNGTGLGLYMSKTMVEEHHNGILKVYNSGDGVVFEILLPIKNFNKESER
jgi:signal transduction histidine kinase